jgi:hypothetical protein
MYDFHNAYNYENIVFIYYVQFSIRVSFACEFTLKKRREEQAFQKHVWNEKHMIVVKK